MKLGRAASRGTIAWTMLACLVACRPKTEPAPPEPAPPTALPPSRHAPGEVVDESVPLQQGGTLPLPELRGKVVLLELVDAGHRDAKVLAEYEALQREFGEALVVVVVSLDRDGWSGDAPALVLGWDPAGALAAKLRAGSIPAVLLVDRDGRVVQQYAGGRDPGHAELIDRARALLGG